jgi:hypothetical protein
MTTLTWLGEDTEDYAGPSFTTWGNRKFPKDKPVEVDNPDMIRRAKGNRFFRVDEVKRGPGRPPKVKTDADAEDQD